MGNFSPKNRFSSCIQGLVRPFCIKVWGRLFEAEGTIHTQEDMKVQKVFEAFM